MSIFTFRQLSVDILPYVKTMLIKMSVIYSENLRFAYHTE